MTIADRPTPVSSYLDDLLDIGWVEAYAATADRNPVVLWNSAVGNRLHVVTEDGRLEAIAETVAGDHSAPFVRGHRVAFFADADGTASTLYVHDLRTGRTRRISLDATALGTGLTWFDDDSLIVVVKGLNGPRLLRVPIEDGRPPRLLVELAAGPRFVDPVPQVGPDGRLLLLAYGEQGQDLVLVEEPGSVRPLIKGNRSAMPIAARWSPDGRRVLVQIRRGSGTELRCVDLQAGVLELLDLPELAGPPAWSPDGAEFVAVVNDWPRTRLVTYELQTRALRPVAGRDFLAAAPSWSEHGLSFVRFGPSEPPGVWQVVDDDVRLLGPAYALPGQPEPELLRLTQPAGFDLPALVYEPIAPERGTVVMLHGGPASAWRIGWDPVLLGLTVAGYRVVLLETRGSTFRAWPVPSVAAGQHGIAEAEDIVACVAQLTARGLITGGAFALMGHSHGAFTAYQASLRLPDVAALVVTSGYLTPDDLLASADDEVRRFHAHTFAGRPPHQGGLPSQCPVLAVHGDHDAQLPVTVAASTFGRLAGDDHQFLELTGDGHAYRDRRNVLRWVRACLAFIDKTIDRRSS